MVEPTAEPTAVAEAPTLLPAVALVGLEFEVPDLLATPTRPPLQLMVPGTDVRIVRQTMFMSVVARLPEFLPKSQTEFYTRTARFIGWFVVLDYSVVGESFEMEGMLRWLNMSTGKEHVIFQRPFVMRAADGNTLFFMTGRGEPGFWTPGKYRAELWDNRDRVIVRYDFEVRSGSVR